MDCTVVHDDESVTGTHSHITVTTSQQGTHFIRGQAILSCPVLPLPVFITDQPVLIISGNPQVILPVFRKVTDTDAF